MINDICDGCTVDNPQVIHEYIDDTWWRGPQLVQILDGILTQPFNVIKHICRKSVREFIITYTLTKI